jgi:alternate signal-mediated exported protein
MTAIEIQDGRRDKRARRGKALVAALCGGALLLGGSTFALWQTSADMSVGNISTGKFDISTDKNEIKAFDISPDRLEGTGNKETGIPGYADVSGDPITATELKTFGLSPKDKIVVEVPATITLEGDNLVAELKANLGTLNTLSDSVNISWELYDLDDPEKAIWGSNGPSAIEGGSWEVGYFTSKTVTAADADDLYHLPDRIDRNGTESMGDSSTKNLGFVIEVEMVDDPDLAASQGKSVDLSALSLTLTQGRTAEHGAFKRGV